MRRRSRLAIAAILVLAAIPMVAAPAVAGAPGSEHRRILDFWTEARMKAAKPREMVLASPRGARDPQPLVANSSGQSWPTGGPNAGGLIARLSGRIYFRLGTGLYVCSGSVATDGRTGYSLVLTAGHCVYDNAQRIWATEWMFMPQADGLALLTTDVPTTCALSPRGCWTAQALVAHSRFTGQTAFTGTAARYDYAFAVVGAGGNDGSQLDGSGSLPIGFSGVSKGNTLYAFGYPAAAPYNGSDLVYCSGKIGQDLFNGNATWSMVCNMTGGSSGGPWLRGFSESMGSGTLASLNSYRYSFSNRMYGPKFTSYTQAVYNAANGATSGTVAVP
jgi:hypothetical protein